MFIGAVAAVWSNKIIARTAIDANLPNLSQMAEKAGGKALAKSLQWMIIVFMFGACISYQIIITSLLKYFLHEFGVKDKYTKDDSMLIGIYEGVPLAVLVLIPLCTLRDMSAFRYISLASIVSLFYMGVVLIVELPAYYRHFRPGAKMSPAYWDLNIFSSFSMCFFAYTC